MTNNIENIDYSIIATIMNDEKVEPKIKDMLIFTIMLQRMRDMGLSNQKLAAICLLDVDYMMKEAKDEN